MTSDERPGMSLGRLLLVAVIIAVLVLVAVVVTGWLGDSGDPALPFDYDGF